MNDAAFPLSQRIARLGVLACALAVAFSLMALASPFAPQAEASAVKAKGYTISKKAGTYSKTVKVKVKCKKGYVLYYSTKGKLKTSVKIKPGKSKTFTFKKTTTLKVYSAKKTAKVTAKKLNKKCKKYKYVVKKASSSSSSDSSGSTDESTSGEGGSGSSSDDTASGTGSITTALSQVDMSDWLYNSSSDVYYQTGISYCESPVDTSYETLGLFVPGDYLTATANSDGTTYTCTLNSSGNVNGYTASTAPMVMPINTAGYSAQSAPTGYSSSAATYTAAGYVYVYAGCRGREHGAPAGVTDLKAAVRYLRYNAGVIPGNPERIFSFGHSGGGAQSAILGASGDSSLYEPYLSAIGAVEGASDAIYGAMCWCPITNLDIADAAYEWNMGASRSASGDDLALSCGLAGDFADYVNDIGLKHDGVTLSITKDSSYSQAGTYYDYIKGVIEDSLNDYLANNTSYSLSGGSSSSGGDGGSRSSGTSGPPSLNATAFSSQALDLQASATYTDAASFVAALNDYLGDDGWASYSSSTGKATVNGDVASFIAVYKSASKGLGAFDNVTSKSQAENTLFNTDGSGGTSHFDALLAALVKDNASYSSYYSSFESDLAATDSLGKSIAYRVNAYNPMFYLSDYYASDGGGVGSSTPAAHWRIRTGITQGDTSLCTEANLALGIENYSAASLDVDFATVWNQGHTEAEVSGSASTNFISWVNGVM